MKIGIIGNMNNSYFSLTRYLRDEGYDCELLILNDEPAHFDPACDTFTNDYLLYCKHVAWGAPCDFMKHDFKLVAKDLSPYDFLIGNGPAPAYVAKIGRQLDLFIPYGYDIYSLPFFRMVYPHNLLPYAVVRYYQKKGIKECRYMLFDRTNKAFEQKIRQLKYKGKRIISPAPMLYHKDFEAGWPDKIFSGPLSEQLTKLRSENEILLVQHGRQLWKKSADRWSYKGNNLLIEGYTQLVKDYPLLKMKLVLFEYGTDVAATKKLIAALGIEQSIVWMPKMPRNELMKVLAVSDMVIGELHHSWLSYGVAIEALCMSKPFMHNRIDEEFAGDYPELYPMLHAFSAKSVYEGLQQAIQDRASMKVIGEKGRDWFLNYCVNKPVSAIKSIIDEKKATVNA